MSIASWTIEEVKSGYIRPWFGLLADIPAGWVLCNGSNGTPDMRDLYIKGAPAGQEAGATGGNLTHTHAGHNDHVFTQPSQHAAQTHSGGAVGSIAATADAGKKSASTGNVDAASLVHTHPAPSFTQPTQHPALSHSGGAVDPHSAHDSPNHEPPYRTTLWIMKT